MNSSHAAEHLVPVKMFFMYKNSQLKQREIYDLVGEYWEGRYFEEFYELFLLLVYIIVILQLNHM